MNAKNFTTADVAARRGCHPVSVIRAARFLKLKKTGRDWIFSPSEAAKLAEIIRSGPGQPQKNPKKTKGK